MQSALALAVPGCLSGQALQTLRRNRAGVRGAESCIPTHKRRRNSSCCWTRTSGLSLVMIRTKCPRVSPFATCSCLTPPSRPPRRAQELCLHIDHVCVCVCVCVCSKKGGGLPNTPNHTLVSSSCFARVHKRYLPVYSTSCFCLFSHDSFCIIERSTTSVGQRWQRNSKTNGTRALVSANTHKHTHTHTHSLSLSLSFSLSSFFASTTGCMPCIVLHCRQRRSVGAVNVAKDCARQGKDHRRSGAMCCCCGGGCGGGESARTNVTRSPCWRRGDNNVNLLCKVGLLLLLFLLLLLLFFVCGLLACALQFLFPLLLHLPQLCLSLFFLFLLLLLLLTSHRSDAHVPTAQESAHCRLEAAGTRMHALLQCCR